MNFDEGSFVYEVDGNYGDYTIETEFSADEMESFCGCPYPGTGCKCTVAAENSRKNDRADVFAARSPKKMEIVFNSGMAFIGGLMEMATGQKMKPVGDAEQMIRIDKSTGEVTMEFRFPGL